MRTQVTQALKMALHEVQTRTQKVALSNSLTKIQQERLDKVYNYFDQLKICLAGKNKSLYLYPGSSTSWTIQWDKDISQSIVIEISLYGSLAAVFVYGSPPDELLDLVDNCLEGCGLVRLTAKEISALEQSGQYHEIF